MFGLDFANWSGAWWGLVSVPICALYLLRIRRRRQTVSTLMFWTDVQNDTTRRAWWQQLRHLLSLVLQLVVVALLAASMADPLWTGQRQSARRIVLIVDNSASMRAGTSSNRTRFDDAKDLARAMVRSLRSMDQLGIVCTSGRPRVVLGLTTQERSLIDAIESIPTTDGPTRMEDAIQLAEQILKNEASDPDQVEIVVISDGCFPPETLVSNIRLTHVGEADDIDNVGITQFQVRRHLRDGFAYQILIEVSNFSSQTLTRQVDITLNEQVIDVLPFELAAHQTVSRTVDHTTIHGGELVARLDAPDGLSSDNTAYALLPASSRTPVQLITEGNLFLQSVFASIPTIELRTTQEFADSRFSGIRVFDREIPSTLPSGPLIVVDPQTACDVWELGEVLEQPEVAIVDPDSPLTQNIQLANASFPGARQIDFNDKVDVLIRTFDGAPLLARLPRPDGDVVVLMGKLEDGQLPLRIAFPILMKNIVQWFSRSSERLHHAVATGESVVIDLPKTVVVDQSPPRQRAVASPNDSLPRLPPSSARLIRPTGTSTIVHAVAGQVTIGPLDQTGFWRLQWTANSEGTASDTNAMANAKAIKMRKIPCNLASKAESNLTRRVSAAQPAIASLSGNSHRPVWFYLTLIGLLLLVVEWWLYQRRIVG